MGFSRGGSTATKAHLHTNAAGQGGSLDETTLIENEILMDFLIPPGTILPWGGARASPPSGYLLCDGQAVSRATYAKLFAEISTHYGIGDGATTFNVPDYNKPIMIRGEAGATPGNTVGADTHTLVIAEIPAHQHTYNRRTGAGNVQTGGASFNETSANTGNAGGGGAHNNIPETQSATFIIRTGIV